MGKRTDKDDDFDSYVEVNDTTMDEPAKSKKAKDKKKSRDDVDELADALKGLALEESNGSKEKKGGDSDDDMPARKGDSGSESEDDAPKGKQKKQKNQVKKGFAALSIESDNESDTGQSKSKTKGKKEKKVDLDDDEAEVKTSKNEGKKKDRKQVDSDDQDLENDAHTAKGKGKKAVDSKASDNEDTKVKVKNKSNAKKNKKKGSDDESEDTSRKIMAEIRRDHKQIKHVDFDYFSLEKNAARMINFIRKIEDLNPSSSMELFEKNKDIFSALGSTNVNNYKLEHRYFKHFMKVNANKLFDTKNELWTMNDGIVISTYLYFNTDYFLKENEKYKQLSTPNFREIIWNQFRKSICEMETVLQSFTKEKLAELLPETLFSNPETREIVTNYVQTIPRTEANRIECRRNMIRIGAFTEPGKSARKQKRGRQ